MSVLLEKSKSVQTSDFQGMFYIYKDIIIALEGAPVKHAHVLD